MFGLKQKKEREQAITEAIKSLCEDICSTTDVEENKRRSEAIKMLMESFSRGGKH